MTVEDKQLQAKIEETGSEETEHSRRPNAGFSMMTSGRRLNADEEKEMATIIRDLEDTAYGILEEYDDLREILEKKPEREERTRAGRVDRLHKAINEPRAR